MAPPTLLATVNEKPFNLLAAPEVPARVILRGFSRKVHGEEGEKAAGLCHAQAHFSIALCHLFLVWGGGVQKRRCNSNLQASGAGCLPTDEGRLSRCHMN